MKRNRKNTRRGLLAAFAALILLIVVIAIGRGGSGLKVKDLTIGDVTDSTIGLSWQPVKHADGYRILLRSASEDAFSEAQKLDGAQASCTLTNLTQATPYEISVVALKDSRETKHPAVLQAMTPPMQGKLDAISQAMDGTDQLRVAFTPNPKAASYELQYMIGEQANFDQAQTLTVQPDTDAFTVSPVQYNQQYYFRVRAIAGEGKNAVAGAWSEPQAYFALEGVDLTGIDLNKPMIALTFDDGPGYNEASDRILDVLEQYGVTATFFMIGENVLDHPENVKRKAALHCEIGNHTMRHDHIGSRVTQKDIIDCSDAIYQTAGVRPTCFRSPGGNTTELIRQECAKENMPLYYWSVDTQDWKYRNADHVYNAVMNNVADGDIILMHEIYVSTADAVARMIPALLDQGYQLVTCRQLIAAKSGKAPESGTQYLDAETIKNETT
ncbi:MAG: polysaccharide deacetylase family protein [Clostridia bacterium]|nr:polysaccharide deacetylase family protein [Clostridia bacterium]